MTRSIFDLKRNLIATSCLAAIAVGAPLAAHAADPSATGAAVASAANPTVVVTAERRAVDIQKAPLAITAARQGQRVIVVVFDSTTLKVRDAKAAELVAKGFAALSAAAPASASPATHPTVAPASGRKK